MSETFWWRDPIRVLSEPIDPLMLELAQRAIERTKNDTSTEREKIDAAVRFIMYGPGGS